MSEIPEDLHRDWPEGMEAQCEEIYNRNARNRETKEMMQSLASTISALRVQQRDYLTELEKLREAVRQQSEIILRKGAALMDWEAREASICPKDVRFDDHISSLRAQLRSKDEQLAGMRAEITVAQLKRAGCQGLAAISARPAINRILHERAVLSGPSPAQEGNGMKTLREKLAEMMPKPREPKPGEMALFDPQPIRRAAESFAHAIGYDLPQDRDELIAMLWIFGEMINGEMERRERYQMKLVHDVLATSPFPLTVALPSEPTEKE